MLKLLFAALLFFSSSNHAFSRVDAVEAPTAMPGEYLVTTADDSALRLISFTHAQVLGHEDLPFGYTLVRLNQKIEEHRARALLLGLGARTVQKNIIYKVQNPLVPLGLALASSLFVSCGKSDPENNLKGLSRQGAGEQPPSQGTDFQRQWALHNSRTGADIRALPAWAELSQKPAFNAKVRVAIIDTGIDIKNKEFAGRIDFASSYNFVGGNTNIQDLNGHGTHVAGIIGAAHDDESSVKGVNPNVELVALKAFTMYGIASSDKILKAVQAAIKAKVRIINASYGGSLVDEAAEKAYEAAGNKGILVVAAAGNESENSDVNPSYPASYKLPNILSVGASDSFDDPARFSNFGPKSVHVFAPGANILSTMVNRSFANSRDVHSLEVNATTLADWTFVKSYGMAYEGEAWSIDECPGAAGRCLLFRTPSDYRPREEFEYFDAVLAREFSCNPEKRYSVRSQVKFQFTRPNSQQYSAGGLLANQGSFLMLPADRFYEQSDWTEIVSDISEPGLFYVGTTGWEKIQLGYQTVFANFQGVYPESTFALRKLSMVVEDPITEPGLESWSGTSMATPHVAGIASWIIALHPNLKPDQVRERITRSCDSVASLREKSVCGGRVNLYKAIQD